MEKVKLTNEQAAFLEHALEFTDNHADLVAAVVATNSESHTAAARLKRVMDVDTLIRALYIGYEVEQTPENKVREMFVTAGYEEKGLGDHPQANWWVGRRMAIIDTLNALGIKISGVNE